MGTTLHSVNRQKFSTAAVVRGVAAFSVFMVMLLSAQQANAQATLQAGGPTSICAGESTTINVLICGGSAPWTVVYTDGTNDYTVTNYESNCDEQLGRLEGDPITVTPSTTTTYTLVSVSFGDPLVALSVLEGSVTVTVNPLPSAVVVSPSARQCPGVNFTISATATNGSTYELWNAANTSKIADLPYETSISANTNYTVRAISGSTPACTTAVAYTVLLENTPPSITCPGNQTLNPNPTTGCSAALPDYRSLATVSDNCTASGSITVTQSPAPGTTISGHNTVQQVTLTATDEAGNEASCNFDVTLIDNVNPTVSCVTNQTVPAAAGCIYTHSGTAWNPTPADNCSGASVTYSANNGASPATGTNLNGVVFQPGTTTVTWTATDGAGNTATCSFNVSIEDTQDPTITFCPVDQTVNTNSGNCSYTHSGTAWNVTATDNCTVGSIVYTLSGATEGTINTTLNGAVFNTGVTTVNVLVSDGASTPNTSTCSFTVTVTDDDAPSVTCPSDISVNTDASACTASVTIPAITFGDNCSSPSLAWSTSGATSLSGNGQPGTQTFNTGVTTVTLTVTDGASLTATCSFTVTVTDNEAPTVTCPDNQTANNSPGSCSASVTIPAITFDDNCTGESLAWSTTGATELSGSDQPGAQTFNVGETTVLLTVTDASLNTATCTFTVTVSDTENPTVACPENITTSNTLNQCLASVAIPTVVFGDNCSSSSLAWSTTGATSLSGSGQPGTQTFNVGTTTVQLTVTDGASNTATCSFTVTVNDTQAPVISGCPANITRTAGAGSCTAAVSWTEPTATDNCTPAGNLVWTKSHTPGTVFSVGTTTVTYTATDGAGNVSATCTFTVTINDLVRPVISGCPANISVGTGAGATTCNAVVSWTEPTATDNCTASGDLVWTRSHAPGSTFPVGTTTVTYTVRDASNNVSNPCTFNVTVTDNTPPVAVCQPVTLTLNASGQATLTTAQVNNGSSDNCTAAGSLILTLSKTSFNCSNIGANTVTLTVRDAAGNISTCNATVTVVDNLAPTITATATTVTSSRNNTSGFCYYTVVGTEFDPTAADNCSGATLSYAVSGATTLSGTGSMAGKNLNAGPNVISWTAADGSGNISSPVFSFTITVVDNQGPVIVGIGNQIRGTDSNACGYTIVGTEFNPTVTDNCSGSVTLSWSVSGATTATGTSTLAGEFMNKGVNIITWTASDGTNSSTSSFRLTVNDDDAPYIEQLSDITVNISEGCGAEVSWTEPIHTDNCPGLTFSQVSGIAPGEEFPVGTTVVRYRALDAAGNETFMSFNVIVNDLTPPTITCPAGSPFARNTDDNFCFYTVQGTEFNPTTNDGCPVTAINSFDGTNTLANKLLPPGTHNIVWTVTDGSSNTSSCTITVVVTDNQNPTFNQPNVGPHAKETDPGECYYTIPDISYDVTNSTLTH